MITVQLIPTVRQPPLIQKHQAEFFPRLMKTTFTVFCFQRFNCLFSKNRIPQVSPWMDLSFSSLPLPFSQRGTWCSFLTPGGSKSHFILVTYAVQTIHHLFSAGAGVLGLQTRIPHPRSGRMLRLHHPFLPGSPICFQSSTIVCSPFFPSVMLRYFMHRSHQRSLQ